MRPTYLIFILIMLWHTSLLGQLQDSCKLNIGVNLAGLSDFSREIPFANLMKMSRQWYTKSVNDPNFEWDSGNVAQLTFDQNGYPTHIPQTIEGVSLPQQVATVWDGTDSWPTGSYTLLWDGTGDFELWGDYNNLVKINENRYEFDYENKSGGILQITMISSAISDPVHNMRLLLPNTEDTYETQPFNPSWLEELSVFKTLRFMDWQHTNSWGQSDPYTWEVPDLVDWSERPKVEDYTYTSAMGIPYELIAQLINELDVDAWICVPHRASDDYITEMSNFFRDEVEEDSHLYVEYSNEVWNWIFGQTQWLNKYGCEEQNISWPEGIVPYIQNTFDLWTASFNEELDRITRVAAVQTAWQDVSERVVYNLNVNTVDAVSPTFYFSFDDESESVLDDLGENATVDDIAYHTRLGMAENLQWIRNIKTISDSLDIQLLFYEGGQHITPIPFGEVPSYDNALFDIHRADVMYDIYNEWLDSIRSLNDADKAMLLMHFSFISPPSTQYGSWGLLERMNQDRDAIPAPKYQSILENMGCFMQVSNTIEKEENQLIMAYPSPTQDYVYINRVNESSKVHISIFNTSGMLCKQMQSSNLGAIAIDLSMFENGLYILKIEDLQTGKVKTEKIIKL